MISGYFLKHPDAVVSHEFDFSNDIPEGDDLNDYTLTVVNQAGDDVLSTDEVEVITSINSTDITIEFYGGIDGENYPVTVIAILGTATTTPTRIAEMRVRSKDV